MAHQKKKPSKEQMHVVEAPSFQLSLTNNFVVVVVEVVLVPL